jgi:hypothetical protein
MVTPGIDYPHQVIAALRGEVATLNLGLREVNAQRTAAIRKAQMMETFARELVAMLGGEVTLGAATMEAAKEAGCELIVAFDGEQYDAKLRVVPPHPSYEQGEPLPPEIAGEEEEPHA